MKNIPLYTQSREAAHQCGEIDFWKESHRANIACAKAVEQAIRDNFDGMHLNSDTAKQVIEGFGFDRVNWVLAATMHLKDYDGRFSHQNRDWSNGFFMVTIREESRAYLVDSHPAVLDGFINQTRRAWQELGLYDHTHCLADSQSMDWGGKVLALRPTSLRDEYKQADTQIFLCSGGFGARADARGRKVYGQFLSDGEQCQFDRQDFLGVVKEEHLPEWALEKLEQIRQPEQEQNLSLEGPSL